MYLIVQAVTDKLSLWKCPVTPEPLLLAYKGKEGEGLIKNILALILLPSPHSPENVVCLICLLHMFKCYPETEAKTMSPDQTAPKGAVQTVPKGAVQTVPKGAVQTVPKGAVQTVPKAAVQTVPKGAV